MTGICNIYVYKYNRFSTGMINPLLANVENMVSFE